MPRQTIVLPVSNTGSVAEFNRGSTDSPPATPGSFAADAGNTEITLTWNIVPNILRYHIYFNTTGSVTNADTRIKITDPNDVSYTHTGLLNGTTYYYKIAAVGPGGESTLSSEVSAVPSTFTNVKSLLFGGTDEYVNHGGDSSLKFERTDPFSVSFWVNHTALTNEQVYVSTLHPSTSQGWEVTKITTTNLVQLQLLSSGANRLRVTSTTAMTVGSWYHVVVTFDGSSAGSGVKMYINNASETTSIVSDSLSATIVNSGNCLQGARPSGYGPLTAYMDEVSIWDKELSPSEASEIYNSGLPGNLAVHSALANLVSWWRNGDGDVYPTISDNAGSNDGTMTNMESGDIDITVP